MIWKQEQRHGHFFVPVPVGQNTPSSSPFESIPLPILWALHSPILGPRRATSTHRRCGTRHPACPWGLGCQRSPGQPPKAQHSHGFQSAHRTPASVQCPPVVERRWQGCPLGRRYFCSPFPLRSTRDCRWQDSFNRRRFTLNRRRLMPNRRRFAEDRTQPLAGRRSAEGRVYRRPAGFFLVLRIALTAGRWRLIGEWVRNGVGG